MVNDRYEARLLLVDDDIELCQLLEQYLGSEHFKVDSVNDGELALDLIRTGNHDAVILDIMLPGINGFEVLRRIRTNADLPVIILTARSDEVDRVVGFEVGADDYLAKPFSPRELAARIRAILRRANRKYDHEGPVKDQKKISVGEMCLDPASRTVTLSGFPIELTLVEFGLLETLLRSAGRVVTRDQLCKEVLDRELSPIDRSVDVHISRLRKKLGTKGVVHERIKTIRGLGYIYADTSGQPGAERTTLQPQPHSPFEK